MATRNALFAVVNVSNQTAVEMRLKELSPALYLSLEQAGQWLVIAPYATTTQELSERLGIHTGESNGLVVRVDTYSGRSAPHIWEWIRAKLEADLGAKTSV